VVILVQFYVKAAYCIKENSDRNLLIKNNILTFSWETLKIKIYLTVKKRNCIMVETF